MHPTYLPNLVHSKHPPPRSAESSKEQLNTNQLGVALERRSPPPKKNGVTLACRFTDGQKTADIGEAITGGSFHGYTLAYEVVGDQNLEAGIRTGIKHKFLRSEATLTVNIPKGSGAGSLQVTMNNFQRWNEESEVWTAYVDNFTVALNGAAIGDSGTFSGLQRRRLQREFLGASRRRGRKKPLWQLRRQAKNDCNTGKQLKRVQSETVKSLIC